MRGRVFEWVCVCKRQEREGKRERERDKERERERQGFEPSSVRWTCGTWFWVEGFGCKVQGLISLI